MNPSLLNLDISNKQYPFIDQTIITAIARSCQCLTVLKLSDYQFEDPNDLLILCGKVVVSKANNLPVNLENPLPMTSEDGDSPLNSDSTDEQTESGKVVAPKDNSPVNLSENPLSMTCEDEDNPLNSDSTNEQAKCEEIVDRLTNMLHLNELSSVEVQNASGCDVACDDVRHALEFVGAQSNDRIVPNMGNAIEDRKRVEERAEELVVTREEEENQRGKNVSRNGSEAESDTEAVNGVEGDFYRDDPPAYPLEVEDHSEDVGCLELDTLWLENVNLTDQVAAVLLQTLLHLRDVNFSGTDICNPWRLIDKSCSKHFKHLEDLDIKSTSLSRSALQMVPEFHPNLRKLSISSTTLPPATYRNITKLSGLGDLQLIGGQFYPCEPDEIFVNGILPAVSGVGRHLESLNMAFFAHVEISKIALCCPVIRHLDLSRTDIFFTCPCSSLGKHCPNLVSLNLGHAHIEARDPSTLRVVSEDTAIHQIIGEPRGLEELHLCGLTLSSEGVRTLFHGVKYPLKFIDTEFCKTLTIAGLCHLWKVCPLLTRIDMTHSRDISISDCKRFADHCYETRPAFKSEGTLNWK